MYRTLRHQRLLFQRTEQSLYLVLIGLQGSHLGGLLLEQRGFLAAQALESMRLTAQARERGVKSGESRRKKAQKKQTGMQEEFSTGVFDNQSESVSESVSERKYVGLSLSNERESGAAGAGPWGPAPPRLEDLPPIPGQRDTNGGDCE